MSFIKLGELVDLTPDAIQATQSVLADEAINDRFTKFAQTLKRIAPKADDFLYFSGIFMHAAEAALINSDGSPKLTSKGEPIKAYWEKVGEGLKWVSNDPSIMPYRNNNFDIFPEQELIKAHKQFIGRPVCIDHRSSSVDGVRGIILDAYYDRKLRRVIGLCAVDRVSFPELARGIETGYKTSLSMGTAVGQVSCMTCHKTARTESEFCSHMRSKTSYGEVNQFLSPLEISVVVSPADPQAKIRTIIAAANTISTRLSEKEEELTKLSSDPQQDRLKELEEDLKRANEKLAELKQTIEEEEKAETTVSPPYGQSSGVYKEPNDEVQQSFGLSFPDRFAHNQALLGELKELKQTMEYKLARLERVLGTFNQEDIMTDKGASMDKSAYWQGGGGVNEPTPKQKKYPVDPKNEQCRTKEDKHMNGQPPFPEVGPVDGMHPSPQSVDQKDELERKKMLLRAEQSDRSLRRSQALQKAKENLMNEQQKKEGYWQGGGGVNEPEPKKVKYDIDPLNEKLRDKEDKQMVGQKPFPGVGPVDGLHPSPLSADEKDELERKKMLQRASLKARFVRVANADGTDNLGASGWNVFTKNEDGEKLVFTASVDEISGGRSDVLFDVIATKEFGEKLLGKIRSEGLSKAASIYKKSQAVAGPAAMPGAPPDATGPGPVPAMDAAPPAEGAPGLDDLGKEDKGGKGDKKEVALNLIGEIENKLSDLKEDVRNLTGEQVEMGEIEEGLGELPKAASRKLTALSKIRRELNSGLLSGMRKLVAKLNDHREELELIANVLDSDTTVNKDYVATIVDDSISDTKKVLSEADTLKVAYDQYLNGTDGLRKQAESAKARMVALANGKEDDSSSSSDSSSSDDSSDVSDVDDNDMKSSKETSEDDSSSADDDLNADFEDDALVDDLNLDHGMDEGFEDEMEDEELDHMEEDDMDEKHPDMTLDSNDVMVDLPPGTPVPTGAKTPAGNMPAGKTASIDLSTKEGRALYRAKLAADATGKQEDGEVQDMSKCTFSDMLDKSDSLANGQTKLDTKPSDNLGLVETPEEVNKAMMDVAKAPPKVRKEAERLNQLISEGTVSKNDLDSLVSEGLDPEVVKYWRSFYGEAGKEGSEFGKLLTTETMKAKAEEEMKAFKVKIARSYELAYDMVRRGLLTDDRISVSAQVDEIMKWNDEAFDSMKRVIAKHAPLSLQKVAGKVPQMGLVGSGDVSAAPVQDTFQSELDSIFSGRRF